MKTFKIVQQYASVAYARRGEKLRSPLPLGTYQAPTVAGAVSQAAKEWKVPALLLHATLIEADVQQALAEFNAVPSYVERLKGQEPVE